MNRSVRLQLVSVAVLLTALFPVMAAERGMPEDIGGVPEEKEFVEDQLQLPAPPGEMGLIEFRPRGNPKNRFYIDERSLSLGADRVIRYALVIKSPSGVANVSYEGMRCKTGEYKVYAFGNRDGQWVTVKAPKWQSTGDTTSNFHYSLWVDYLCDSEAVGGRNAKDLVARFKGDPLNNFEFQQR
jgi:hypothetical protein